MQSCRASLIGLLALSVVATADDCECLNWKKVHEAGVRNGAGWEQIERVGNSIYKGLDANLCIMKVSKCLDGSWMGDDYMVPTTWCFVNSSCGSKVGTVTKSPDYGWKVCSADGTEDFCHLSPKELVEYNQQANATDGLFDPAKFPVWACPYSPTLDLNSIVSETLVPHMEGCGFNDKNAPTITAVPMAMVADDTGCRKSGEFGSGFSDIEDPGRDAAKAAPIQEHRRTAALSALAKAKDAEERARLIKMIDATGSTAIVSAGMSESTVDSPDACDRPYSIYIVGHGQILFCYKNGPLKCECEKGCD